ncbi:MAG: hypothetical protein JXR71_00580 [Bacteroidales bacterium]|nr:hypothetical protein [Bacteroidales bacterium]
MLKHYFLSLFFFLAISFQAVAGWVITEQSTNKYGQKTFQTTFIQGNYIRLDAPTLVSIFNLKEKKIVLLFPQDKAYWEGNPTELQQQFRNMMAKQVQLMMTHAPDTQKDTLQKIYNGLIAHPVNSDSIKSPEINVVQTGQKATMLGHPVQLYNVKMDSVLLEKIWVTLQLKPYAGLPMEETLRLTNAINPFSGNGPVPISKDYINLLKNGVVLKRISYGSGKNPNVSTVTEIREAKIIETIFEIPANYQPMNIEQVMQLDLGRNILNPVLPGKEQRINLSPPPPFKVNQKQPRQP